MKKVLLINPPATIHKSGRGFNVNLPMGLGYIAAVLEVAGYNVTVLDALIEGHNQRNSVRENAEFVQIGMTFEQIGEFIKNRKPDFVGITSMFSTQAQNVYRVASCVKEIDKLIPVIVGGAHATAEPKNVIQNNAVDYVIIGEGENCIAPLLKAIELSTDVSLLKGIVYKISDGQIVMTDRGEYVDVDSMPMPARHLFPIEKYFAIGERHGIKVDGCLRSFSILTSRGCPFHCNFCSAYQLFGRKFRFRQADDVINEIDYLITHYEIDDLYFNDDQFLCNRKRAIDILDAIAKRNYRLRLDAPNGISPWLLDEEIIIKMKAAGFWRVALAVESGNQWVLDNIIQKPVKIDKLPALINLLKKYNLEITVFLVVGNISENAIETFQQMRDSFDLIRRLGVKSVNMSYLTPHPGSAIYDVAVKRGYLLDQHREGYYGEPKLSTPLWDHQELFAFATVESIFCTKNGLIYRLMLTVFIRTFWDYFGKERCRVLYSIIKRMRRVRSVKKY